MGQTGAGRHAVGHGGRVGDGQAQTVERRVQFAVAGAEIDHGAAFLLDQRQDVGIVVALVLAADDEHDGRRHGLEGHVAGIDVGGLAVVDIVHAADGGHALQAVLHAGEVGQTGLYRLGRGAGGQRRLCRRQSVAQVVQARQREATHRHGEGHGGGEAERAVVGIARRARLGCVGEGQDRRRRGAQRQFVGDVLVARPVDEGVARLLVLHDAHLRVDVVLHDEAVAVQMVRRDVEQHGHVGAEVVHAVELERRQFDDICGVRFAGHLQRQAVADVARQPHVHAGLVFQDVIDQARRRGLAVASRDADHTGVGVASGKLNLADDRHAAFAQRRHHGCRVGDARALDHQVGLQDAFGRVAALFPGYALGVEHLLVAGLDAPHV